MQNSMHARHGTKLLPTQRCSNASSESADAGRPHSMLAQEDTTDFEFETMYKELKAWRDNYATTVVPKQVRPLQLLARIRHEISSLSEFFQIGVRLALLDSLADLFGLLRDIPSQPGCCTLIS